MKILCCVIIYVKPYYKIWSIENIKMYCNDLKIGFKNRNLTTKYYSYLQQYFYDMFMKNDAKKFSNNIWIRDDGFTVKSAGYWKYNYELNISTDDYIKYFLE